LKETLAGSAPPEPKSLEDLAKLAGWVARQTFTMQMDARTSEATTKALRNAQLIYEKRDLEQRLKAALKELAELRKPRRVA